jgi:class 3 adenylate cyclase
VKRRNEDSASTTAAAARAGLAPAYLHRLQHLGLLSPDVGGQYTKGQVRRARLIRTFEEAGIPLDGLAQAVQRRHISLDFVESEVYERFASLTDETFADVSRRTGVPFELLAVLREAIGLAPPSPDDRVREDELAAIPFVEVQLRLGFRPPAIERLLRVTGESMRRIAEQEADWWRTEVIEPRLASGVDTDEVANPFPATDMLEVQKTYKENVNAIHDARRAHAWTGNIISGLEYELNRLGLYSRIERPPAIAFLDVTGYTRLTQERGDEAAAALAERLNRLVDRAARAYRGKPIKWLGDGVMLYFDDPGRAVGAALEMADAVTEAELPPAHIGIHAGPVLYQEGDYFGTTVNVASRIAEYARPKEVLVSEQVVEAAADGGAKFVEIGPVELKGVGGPLELYSAQRP